MLGTIKGTRRSGGHCVVSLRSLDDETLAHLDKNWKKEIRRRLKEIDEGKAKLVPWQTAKQQIFGDA
jgi:hypothetical protein